jgi:hypothetical protein
MVAAHTLAPNGAMGARTFFEIRLCDALAPSLVENILFELKAPICRIFCVLNTGEEKRCHLQIGAVLHMPPVLDVMIGSHAN